MSYTDGVRRAREAYAQAWCDGIGEAIEAVDFTPAFVECWARELSVAREERADLLADMTKATETLGSQTTVIESQDRQLDTQQGEIDHYHAIVAELGEHVRSGAERMPELLLAKIAALGEPKN